MPPFVRIVRGRRFQTPVVRLRHPLTGRRVTLVGVMHTALPEYYRQIAEVIAELEAGGALVQAEAPLRPEDGQEPVTLTEQQQAVGERVARIQARQLAAVAKLGWVYQAVGMPEPPSWQRINTTPAEDVALAGDAIEASLDQQEQVLYLGEQHPNVYRIITAIGHRHAVRAKRNATPSAIIERCNERALAAVHATDRDVVMVWGASHLRVFIADLTGHGYERAQPPTWYTAVRLPSIAAAVGRMLIRRKPRDLTHQVKPAMQTTTQAAAPPASADHAVDQGPGPELEVTR